MSVVIVGNGTGLLGTGLGPVIDSFDTVVRMGRCVTTGFEKDYGTKVDVYGINWFLIEKLLNFYEKGHNSYLESSYPFNIKDSFSNLGGIFSLFDYSSILFSFEHPKNLRKADPSYQIKWSSDKYNHFYNHDKIIKRLWSRDTEFSYLSMSDFNLHLDAAGVVPSSGFFFLNMVLELFKDEEIYLAGFDGFSSGWYWYPDFKHSVCHPMFYELMFIEKLKRKGILKILRN